MSQLAKRTTILDIEKEYNIKVAKINETIANIEQAVTNLGSDSCIQGYYGELKMPTLYGVHPRLVLKSLKTSAWNLAFNKCNIVKLAPESEIRKFKQAMSSPPDFTAENFLSTFGEYVFNPEKGMLNAFAEVFMGLDQSYKSHEKVKVGAKGLPKRVIVGNLGSIHGYGHSRLESIINALAIIEGKPLTEYDEVANLMKKGICSFDINPKQPERKAIERGVKLKRFKNGNGHLYFEPEQLSNINRALAAFYGDVLPDSPEANLDKKESTAVSKDLQFYKTPRKLLNYILENLIDYRGLNKDSTFLEPSCGDGAIIDALKSVPFSDVDGIECDFNRANIAKSKGHNVFIGNFLETEPVAKYDMVIMNPPFYGLHYVKHVEHAKKFLKNGGRLYSILPITARDDHKKLEGFWQDLPAKSFAESGTNINTVLYTFTKE